MKLDFDRGVRRLRIALILMFWSCGLIWYSIRADRRAEIDRSLTERLVVFVCGVPGMVKDWYKVASAGREHQELLLDPKLDIYKLGQLDHCPAVDERLYLLHYRYEGDHKGKVYLQNIKTGEVARTWDIPLETVLEDLEQLRQELAAGFREKAIPINMAPGITRNIPAIQINSPIMGKDFSLFFHCGSLGRLYKLDENSKIAWKSEETVHHSIELDEEGNIWTCSVNWGHPLAKANRFREDAVLCLDANGARVHLYSLSDILAENDLLERLLAATPSRELDWGLDPYHLNDVLPVRSDGKFWKKGDVFLSLRNKSLVIQYRPQDGSIVWRQQGPWLSQHDVNVVNDSVISVFNNNVPMMHDKLSEAGSNIACFDFAEGTTQYFGQGLFASKSEGRQINTVNGQLLVEETNKGIYLLLDSTGALLCRFYIPYYANPSHAMNPTWSRLYLKEGSQFLLQ